jgi:excisionase family DNA binding protein
MTPLLTAQEVADRLGVSKDWVWAQARAATIPHVRLGRYRRFRAEAIEAWIVELETSSTVTDGPAVRVPARSRERAHDPVSSTAREAVAHRALR